MQRRHPAAAHRRCQRGLSRVETAARIVQSPQELQAFGVEPLHAEADAIHALGVELARLVQIEAGRVALDGDLELFSERAPAVEGLEHAVERAMTAEEYFAGQTRRVEDAEAWLDWFAEHRVDALVEPTIPIVAPLRGAGYEDPWVDLDDLSLTHYWDWTGFPVVSLPSGVGRRSGLPTSISLIGVPGADWDVLAWGTALQAELGTVAP